MSSAPEDLLPASAIPAAAINAYLAADYMVFSAEPFALKIGQTSPELARWFKHKRTDSAAFITAWNPLGEPAPDAENRAAQKKLLARIKAEGMPYLDGEGRDPSGQWPGEPSLLVFGISLETARKLAGEFRQNGLVYAGSDTTPQLVLLR